MTSVDDTNELSERVRNLPTDIETEWPEASVFGLALGQAVPLGSLVTSRDEKRSIDTASRFFAEPEVQVEERRISAMAGAAEPFPFDAEDAELEAWIERDGRRNKIISEEATRFAATHRFSYISPRGVTSFLKLLLNEWWRDQDGRLPPTKKSPALVDTFSIYVNPLADREVSVSVPPGHIAVVLTQAASEDLDELGRRLGETRERLSYKNRPGGRPPGGTTWTKKEFLEGLSRAKATFEERHLHKPTQTDLATEMGISKSTFDRYNRKWVDQTT